MNHLGSSVVLCTFEIVVPMAAPGDGAFYGLRVGPDVEALTLRYCSARPVASIAATCREAYWTCWGQRQAWIWRYTNSLFAFTRVEEALHRLELHRQAEEARRDYVDIHGFDRWAREAEEYNSGTS